MWWRASKRLQTRRLRGMLSSLIGGDGESHRRATAGSHRKDGDRHACRGDKKRGGPAAARGGSDRTMLAFDIETFGLDPSKTKISVICTECIFTGERKTFEFAKHDREVGGPPTALTAELVATLDAAQSLSAFNGVRFDIPFIQIALKIPEEKVRAWVLKTTDILEYVRLINNHTFKLDLLCERNDMPMKSGTGLFAITLAQEGRWKELNGLFLLA